MLMTVLFVECADISAGKELRSESRMVPIDIDRMQIYSSGKIL